ncbi:hypothetical protein BDV95DRAFT_557314 [Massariosphaeria phaeospora]|uniref:Uncharacterized protein n=1 Tax=Massariosphaeria phaeospora TaxID=100035 RepID=A0A7C8IFI9_9PLEO|nr:hypothetical protein BDV95DRAFT_557314 [Massariosphaeria phaeospora]
MPSDTHHTTPTQKGWQQQPQATQHAADKTVDRPASTPSHGRARRVGGWRRTGPPCRPVVRSRAFRHQSFSLVATGVAGGTLSALSSKTRGRRSQLCSSRAAIARSYITFTSERNTVDQRSPLPRSIFTCISPSTIPSASQRGRQRCGAVALSPA